MYLIGAHKIMKSLQYLARAISNLIIVWDEAQHQID